MSLKVGNNFVAGNIALRVQDRIYTLNRSMEEGVEYFDVSVPDGVTFSVMDASRYSFVVDADNTTSGPIFRHGSVVLTITNNFGNPIVAGDFVQSAMYELYCITLDSGEMRLRGGVTSYVSLTEKPTLNDVIIASSRSLQDYSIAKSEISGTDLLLKLNTKTYGAIKTGTIGAYTGDVYRIGKSNAAVILDAVVKPQWYNGNITVPLATEQDISNIVIPNNYKGTVTYAVTSYSELTTIVDAEEGDKCLVSGENKIYQYADIGGWTVDETLSSINSDYYEVEEFLDEHRGRATYNGVTASWDFFKIYTILYNDNIIYTPKVLPITGWTGKTYLFENIELVSGDKLFIYPRAGETTSSTKAMRQAYARCIMTWEGDDADNTVLITVEELPTIDINIMVEVRR